MTSQTLFSSGVTKCDACRNDLVGKIKTCYACLNDLVDTKKYDSHDDNFWECRCQQYECECCYSFYCPLCDAYALESDHLAKVITDYKARWIANMITHYRHVHISSWNKMWDKKNGSRYQQKAKFTDYDTEKAKVNERAKRQIVRKCTSYLKENGINKEHFILLNDKCDPATLNLMDKLLPIKADS